MHIDRPTLKREARQAMGAARPRTMLVTLLFILLTVGPGILAGMIASDPTTLFYDLAAQGLTADRALLVLISDIGPVGLFLHILIALFNTIMLFGYQQWALNVSRMRNPGISDLVCGFSMVGRILFLNSLLAVCRLVLNILFTMAAQLALLLFIWIPLLAPLASLFLVLFAALTPYFLMFRYSMAAYCLMDDPTLGPLQAMRRSRQLTKGHLAELILLNLSFVGWILLGVMIITSAFLCIVFPAGSVLAIPDISANILNYGIAAAAVLCLVFLAFALWLFPYISVTECKFYDRLSLSQTQEVPFDL